MEPLMVISVFGGVSGLTWFLIAKRRGHTGGSLFGHAFGGFIVWIVATFAIGKLTFLGSLEGGGAVLFWLIGNVASGVIAALMVQHHGVPEDLSAALRGSTEAEGNQRNQ